MQHIARTPRTRNRWIVLTLTCLCAVALLHRVASAEPAPKRLGQTVPLPTATATQAPPPTATPIPDDDRDNDDQDNAERDDNAASEGETAVQGVSDGSLLQAQVDVNTLNARTEPVAGSTVVGTLSAGEIVEVTERTADSTWYFVCCTGSGEAGWSGSQFLTPLGLSRAEMNQRLATESDAAATESPDRAAVQADSPDTNASPLASSPALSMTVEQLSPFAIQGKTVELLYTIRNLGQEAAREVTLHNDLPIGLFYVDAETGSGTLSRNEGENQTTSISVAWDALPASQLVTVTLTLEIDDGFQNGATIDNLASAGAANADSASGGLSIGLPPAALPTFQ